MGEFIGMVAVVMIFGIPLSAILTAHRRQVLEMKLRMKEQGDQGTVEALHNLQQEMMQLRDTTSRFDVGFDTALQRIEGRLNTLEQRVSRVEDQNTNPSRQG